MQKYELDKEKLILAIFSEISVPFLAIDFQKLKKSLERFKESKSYIAIHIEDDQKLLISALRAIIKQYDVPEIIDLVLSKSKLIVKKNDIYKLNSKENLFTLGMDGKNLIWEESSLWPISYSTFIHQLINLTKNYKFLIEERRKELNGGDVLSEYSKNLPTEIHSAFASLGSLIGGSINFEYLAKYSSKYQIYNSLKNKEYANRINYTNDEADELTNSGIIILPATLVVPLLASLPEKGNILGSIPIDECNIANLPENFKYSFSNKEKEDIKYLGFIMDKYYRSIFSAVELDKKYALYGKDDVLRDHYTDFYNGLDNYELLRCKHYGIPLIDVSSIDEMQKIISKMPKRGENGIFFRGQTSYYSLNREERVKKVLFGDSNSNEPSIVTNASRSNYNYDHLHFILKYFLEHEIIFKDYKNQKEKKETFQKLEELKSSFLLKLDYAVVALAQHYGLPTHGLDVTTDLDVAAWFATNKFNQDGNIASYTKMNKDDWKKDKNKWPTVFVFQNVLNSTASSLQDCVDLESIGIKALRPERQSAKFFHAAHGDHQNRLAESLVCAFRLSPNLYETKYGFDYLFPSPEEDEAYKFMINFSETEILDDLQVPREKVTKFH